MPGSEPLKPGALEAWAPGNCFLLGHYLLQEKRFFLLFLVLRYLEKEQVIHSGYDQGRKDGALTSLPPNPRAGRPGSVCPPQPGIQAQGPSSSGGALGSQLLQPSRLMVFAFAFLQQASIRTSLLVQCSGPSQPHMCCEWPLLLLRHLIFYFGACCYAPLQVRTLPPIGSLLGFCAREVKGRLSMKPPPEGEPAY